MEQMLVQRVVVQGSLVAVGIEYSVQVEREHGRLSRRLEFTFDLVFTVDDRHSGLRTFSLEEYLFGIAARSESSVRKEHFLCFWRWRSSTFSFDVLVYTFFHGLCHGRGHGRVAMTVMIVSPQ